ncbi:unnamed protein product, partial [Mesorhabditis spiculigera]
MEAGSIHTHGKGYGKRTRDSTEAEDARDSAFTAFHLSQIGISRKAVLLGPKILITVILRNLKRNRCLESHDPFWFRKERERYSPPVDSEEAQFAERRRVADEWSRRCDDFFRERAKRKEEKLRTEELRRAENDRAMEEFLKRHPEEEQIGEDDLDVGYAMCDSVDEEDESDENEGEEDAGSEARKATAAGDVQDTSGTEEAMDTEDDLCLPAAVQARKRHSVEILEDDDETETVVVRKRHRSAPETSAASSMGQIPAYLAASTRGRGKYVPLSAWTKEEKIAATLLVEDGMTVEQLFDWARQRGYLIKRTNLKNFVYRVRAGQGATRKAGSGRPNTLMNLHMADLEKAIAFNPRISGRQLASVVGITEPAVRRLCKELGYKRYKMQPVQRLTDKDKEKRLTCASNFLRALDSGEISLRKIVFSDEKFIHIDPPKAHQHIFSKAKTKREVEEQLLDLPHGKPKGVGFTYWGGISGDGKKLPLLIMEQGQTIGGREYRYFLNDHIIQNAQHEVGPDFVYQHDWAPAHNDARTHQLLIDKGIRYLDRSEYDMFLTAVNGVQTRDPKQNLDIAQGYDSGYESDTGSLDGKGGYYEKQAAMPRTAYTEPSEDVTADVADLERNGKKVEIRQPDDEDSFTTVKQRVNQWLDEAQEPEQQDQQEPAQ